IGVAEDAAVVLLGEEAEDARAGLPALGDVVRVQSGGIAAIRDGVEVQAERPSLGEQQGRQAGGPARQEPLLVRALGAGGGGGGGLLRAGRVSGAWSSGRRPRRGVAKSGRVDRPGRGRESRGPASGARCRSKTPPKFPT